MISYHSLHSLCSFTMPSVVHLKILTPSFVNRDVYTPLARPCTSGSSGVFGVILLHSRRASTHLFHIIKEFRTLINAHHDFAIMTKEVLFPLQTSSSWTVTLHVT